MRIVHRIQIAVLTLGLATIGCAQPSVAPRTEPTAPSVAPSATPTQVAVPLCIPPQILCRCPNKIFCATSCSICFPEAVSPTTPDQSASLSLVTSPDALALGPVTETCGHGL